LREKAQGWQRRLGLEHWKITVTRTPPDGTTDEYAGEEPGSRTMAECCQVDTHSLKAVIYVAPGGVLKKIGVSAEEVLVHEMLHIRLAPLVMIPKDEAVGLEMVLENTINGLTKALRGRKNG
jgi:hypothetical protein